MINFYNILFYIYHTHLCYIYLCGSVAGYNARASFHKVIMEQGRNVESKTETGLKTFDFFCME